MTVMAPLGRSRPVATPTVSPALRSGQAQAAAAGQPVLAAETATSSTYANPDGTFTVQAGAGPLHVWRNGGWLDVNTSLTRQGGELVPSVTPADVSFSAGGAGAAATLTSGSMVYALGWLSGLPAPAVSGDTATYANVAPNVDLVLTATRLGYEQSFVLKARPAGPVGTLRLPVKLSGGLALSQDPASGVLSLVDSHGTLVAQSGQPGYPTSDTAPVSGGYNTSFQGGQITYSTATGAHDIRGALATKYDALGGPAGFLGFATSDNAGAAGGGYYSNFQGGQIVWSQATGAYYLRGAILAKYTGLGGSGSALGYPTSDESGSTANPYNYFQNGQIQTFAALNATLARLNPFPFAAGDTHYYSYEKFTLGDRVTLKVNRGSGDALVEATDLSLAGVVGNLTLGHVYNSLMVGDSAGYGFGSGAGWSSSSAPGVQVIRHGAEPDTLVDVYDPSGHDYRFTQASATTFTAPAGIDADLTVDAAHSHYDLKYHSSSEDFQFAYSSGQLTYDTDRNGNQVSFAHPSGTEIDITGTRGTTAGRTVVLSLDASGRVTRLAQSAGGSTRQAAWTYNGAGDLTGYTDPAGAHWGFGYDPAHDLTTITDPTAAAVVTRLAYDGYGRVTSVTRDPAGTAATTALAYDDTNNLTMVTDADNHPAITYHLDGSDRITQVDDTRGTQKSSYNANPATDDNNPTSSTNAAGQQTGYGYQYGNESLNQTTAGTIQTSSTYSTSNPATQYLPQSATDSASNQTGYTYDTGGNLTGTSSGKAAETGQAHLTYNSSTGLDGTVATATSPRSYAESGTANASTYSYDGNDDLTRITPPPTDHGALAGQSYTYDGYGRLASTTTGTGTTLSYAYDNDDRITATSYSDITHTVTTGYDPAGRLVSRDDAAGHTGYTYDHLGRLTGKSGSAVSAGPLGYSYDAVGNLTGLTDGRGSTGYTFTNANEPSAVTEGKTGRHEVFNYNADHRRIDTWYAATGGTTPGVVTGWAGHTHTSYDANNQITEVKTTGANSDADTARISDLTYTYASAALGRDTNVRQSVTDELTGKTTNYTYDSRARLTSAVTSGGPTYSYGYDADGNITSGSPGTHTYNHVDQLTAPATGYDANGNQTTGPASNPALSALAYNGASQTTSITPTGSGPTPLAYAGTGQDERSTAGSTGYSTGQPGVQSQTTGGHTTYYDRDPSGQLIAEQTPDGNEYYYTQDGQGSVIALITPTGTVAATYTYDPYGGHLTIGKGTSPDTSIGQNNPWRYTSGYQDTPTGLYHYGARYYDPTLNRWTQIDPQTHLLDLKQGDPYAYSGDDPINNTDPRGRELTGTQLGDAVCNIGVLAGVFPSPLTPFSVILAVGCAAAITANDFYTGGGPGCTGPYVGQFGNADCPEGVGSP